MMKAVIAAGYNVCSTDGISGFDVDVYKNYPDEIYIRNILSGWSVEGKLGIKVPFKPSDDELAEDEPLPFTEDDQSGGS